MSCEKGTVHHQTGSGEAPSAGSRSCVRPVRSPPAIFRAYNRTTILGNWIGTQLTYRIRPSFAGDITLGVEGSIDLRNVQQSYDVSPVAFQYLNTSNPDRSIALIFQDEKKLSRRWKLDLGIRGDKSYLHEDFVSPRAALIYQGSDWTYEFLYGRSFRSPSNFQLFFDDGVADAANPNLHPESADTLEFDVSNWNSTVVLPSG
jgi:hypothetical protein